MKRKFLLYVLIIFSSLSVLAQPTGRRKPLKKSNEKISEFMVGLGVSHLFTDIGGAETLENALGFRDIEMDKTRPVLFGGARMRLFEDIIVGRANLYLGMATGNDAGSARAARGYFYNTYLMELSAVGEWNFWRFDSGLGSLFAPIMRTTRARYYTSRFYLFAGLGAVMALPQFGISEGKHLWEAGETVKNFGAGMTFPIGLGFQTDVDSNWALGIEIGRRFTTTDFLEGFSTVYSHHKDTYWFTSLHVSYIFRKSNYHGRSNRRK